MNDPIIDEIRKIRDNHAISFDYDLDAICSDYKAKHQKYVQMLAEIKKKKVLTKSG